MKTEKKKILVFGYGLSAILCFIATKNFFTDGWQPLCIGLYGGALVLVTITLCRFPLLKRVYDLWMIVARFIGHVFLNIILILVFYLIFTPIGFFMRLFKKDFLELTIEADKDSYWNKRDQEPFDPQKYTMQF